MQDFDDFAEDDYRRYRERPKSRAWVWILILLAVLFVLPCTGLLAVLAYIGAQGPETSVCAGNQVPAAYIDTMKEVGAIDEGETILYFYSDALLEIRDGFYFVSDRKVVIYSEEAGDPPLIKVAFDEIQDLDLARDESFFTDSEITLVLMDGRVLAFPVSSEKGNDQRFFDAIKGRVPDLADNADEQQPDMPEADEAQPPEAQGDEPHATPGTDAQEPVSDEQDAKNEEKTPDSSPANTEDLRKND